MASTPQSRGPLAPPVLREKRGAIGFWPIEFYRTAVGKKAVMALSGIVLLSFVLFHMAGNLKIYMGAEDLNHYGEWLRTVGQPLLPEKGLLWIMRSGLILAFILHIHAATTLTIMNRQARPAGYKGGRDFAAANYASRTMRWSGVIVGLFLIFHLMDLTWGYWNPDFHTAEPGHNLVASFERTPVAIVYIVANLLLGIRIYHGAWSMFQSMGWGMARFKMWRRYFAIAFAAIIVIGNVSFPIAVMTGIVE